MKLDHTVRVALILVLAAAGPRAAHATEYEVLDLGPAGDRHQPWSVNQDGQVCGYTDFADGHDEGFVFDGTHFILIGFPSGISRSDLLGINGNGEAAGKSGTVYENGQAILWTPGGPPPRRLRSLGTLGGSRSAATSINDLRQVVGWSKLPGDTASRAFLWQNDQMSALPVLGGDQAQAAWINNAGQIVGSSTTGTDGLQQFAVLWENGTVHRLPPEHPGLNNIANHIHDNGDIAGSVGLPRGSSFTRRAAVWRNRQLFLQLGTLADGTPAEDFASSWAACINARGEIVGMSVNAQSALVPFIWRDGRMTQLDELMPAPWIAVFVGSGCINDAGQIAVSAVVPGESGQHALLLTPIGPRLVTPRR